MRRLHRSGLNSTAVASIAALLATTHATAAAPLDFDPCPRTPDYECAPLVVPLDPAGGQPDALTLQVRRLLDTREADDVLVALAGGPGQSSTRFISEFADVLAEGLENRQLVVIDQRGTGDSGALACAALRDVDTTARLERLAPLVGRCGRELGEARRFFTTTEVVEDLESLRRALGIERISIYGISYGSYVAQRYARRYSQHTDRLVLDSPVAQDQGGPFDRSSYAAVAPVLRGLCSRGACRGITANPVADVSRLSVRLRRTALSGRVYDGRGRRRSMRLASVGELFDLLVSTDFSPPLRAAFPAAVHSALRGDSAPLLRLLAIDQGTTDPREFDEENDEAPREFSNAVYFATTCQEKPLPWGGPDAPLEERRAQRDAALAAMPAGVFGPFGLAGTDSTQVGTALCERWPPTQAAPVPDPAPIDAPALILSGTTDLRTPVAVAKATAAMIPDGSLVTVPGGGHSLVSSRLACVRTALRRFFAQDAVGNPCAGLPIRRPALEPAPVPPRRLGAVSRSGLRGSGSTVAAAALASVRDAARVAVAQGALDGPFSFGGLRGGSICVHPGGTGPSGRRPGIFRFRRAIFVPDLVLSGRVSVKAGRIARLRLSVRGAGPTMGRLVLRGRILAGRLGRGHPARVRLSRSSLSLPPLRFGEIEPGRCR